MRKVLNIINNGLHREGIALTQIEFFKFMDLEQIWMVMGAVHDNSEEIMEEFRRLGCEVKIFPDRRASFPTYLFALYKHMREEKYDVFHIHGSSALVAPELLVATLAGCKVRIVHSRNTRCSHDKIHGILRPMMNLLATHRFACGEDAGRWLFGKKDYKVIHNGKDLVRFAYNPKMREQIRTEYGLVDNKIIGHVGHFTDQKNHEFLIDVFAKYHEDNPSTKLVLMGCDTDCIGYMDRMKKKVKDYLLEEDVLFLGSVPNVPAILNAMDVMLLPSRFEGLPNVVLEWQANGLPMILSDKITRECSVCGLVQYESIDHGIQPWVSRLESMGNSNETRVSDSEDACIRLREKDFDIRENAVFMQNFYKNVK